MTATNTNRPALGTDDITGHVDRLDRVAMTALKAGDIVIWPGGPEYRRVASVETATAAAGVEVSGFRCNRPDKLLVVTFADGGSIVRPVAGHHQITRVVLSSP